MRTIVASPEKLHRLCNELCSSDSNNYNMPLAWRSGTYGCVANSPYLRCKFAVFVLQIRRVCVVNSPCLPQRMMQIASLFMVAWRFSRPSFRGGHTGSPLRDTSSIKKTSPSLGRSCIMPQRHVSVVYFTITFFPLIMYMPLCIFSLVTRCPLRLYIFSSALSLLSCVMPSMPVGSVLMR